MAATCVHAGVLFETGVGEDPVLMYTVCVLMYTVSVSVRVAATCVHAG